MKKLLLAIFTATVILTSSVSADTVYNEPVSTITENISFDGFIDTVTGYIARIKYNALALAPKLFGTDILGEDCYGNSNLEKGIFAADIIVGDDGYNILALGWADRTHHEIISGENLATVEFDVIDTTAADSENNVTLETTINNVALTPDRLFDDTISYKNSYNIIGEITVPDSTASSSAIEVSSDDIVSGSAIVLN